MGKEAVINVAETIGVGAKAAGESIMYMVRAGGTLLKDGCVRAAPIVKDVSVKAAKATAKFTGKAAKATGKAAVSIAKKSGVMIKDGYDKAAPIVKEKSAQMAKAGGIKLKDGFARVKAFTKDKTALLAEKIGGKANNISYGLRAEADPKELDRITSQKHNTDAPDNPQSSDSSYDAVFSDYVSSLNKLRDHSSYFKPDEYVDGFGDDIEFEM